MRAVLDPNVLVSALLSRTGPPARVIACWLEGAFELVVSEGLLAELEPALAYPKVRERIAEEDAVAFVALLRRAASLVADVADPPRRSVDAGDDYLLALGARERAMVVSGDRHLLDLADRLPVRTARQFLEAIDT